MTMVQTQSGEELAEEFFRGRREGQAEIHPLYAKACGLCGGALLCKTRNPGAA